MLRELIATCRDGQQGFRVASELVTNDPELKMLLSSFSLQCSKFAGEHENELVSMGEPASERQTGSFSGAIHRGWLNLKAAVGGFNNRAILVESEREADRIISEHKKALANDLPDSLRQTIQRHLDEFVPTHNTIRSLRDSAVEQPSKLEESARGITRTVRRKGEQAAAGAAEAWGEMKTKAEDAVDLGERYVRRNPFSFLGGALLLGFGIGMLFYTLELRNERIRLEMSGQPLHRVRMALAGWLGFLAGRARSGYRSSVEQVQDVASQAPRMLFRRRNRFSGPIRSAWRKMVG